MTIRSIRLGSLLVPILATFSGCSSEEEATSNEGNTVDAGDPDGSLDTGGSGGVTTGASGGTGGVDTGGSGGVAAGGGTGGVETAGSGGLGAAGGASGAGGAGAAPGSDGSIGVDAGSGGSTDAGSDGDVGSCPPFATLDAGISCSLSLCTTATGFEIRLTNPDGWHVGALDWNLAICDATLSIYRYPGGGLQTLAFPVTDAEFAALDKNASVRVSYGPIPASARSAECGTLISILSLPVPIGECVD